MSQHDMNIANQSFPSFRSDLNNALSAIQTTHSGTSRPTGAVAGQIWLDTTSATSPTLKFYDGADDISLATVNYTTNTVDWLDSSVTITGLSTTATGTVLTLTDTAHTTTVNMVCGNNTALRFNELTANGSNYIGLKAPASLSADLTFTLPSTDGTSGQFLKTDGAGNLSFSSSLPTSSVGITQLSATGSPSSSTFLRGDNSWASAGATAGQVIQVVSTTKVDTFTASGFSSYNYVDITGLTVTITPSSSANKILIMGYISGGGDNAIYRIQKNSSTLTGYLATQTGSFTLGFGAAVSNSIYQVTGNAVINYLDSPSSTSALTYKLQVTGNGTVSINRPTDTEDSINRTRTVSTITVMEIKG